MHPKRKQEEINRRNEEEWKKEKEERFVRTLGNVPHVKCSALGRNRGVETGEGVMEGVLRLLNQTDAFPKCSAVILPQLGLAHRKQMEVIKPRAGWTL